MDVDDDERPQRDALLFGQLAPHQLHDVPQLRLQHLVVLVQTGGGVLPSGNTQYKEKSIFECTHAMVCFPPLRLCVCLSVRLPACLRLHARLTVLVCWSLCWYVLYV